LRIFLDANLLIYLNTLSEASSPLKEFYAGLLKEDLYTNLLVVDELLYLSFSKYRVPYPITLDFLKTTVLPFATLIPIEESDLQSLERYIVHYGIRPSDAIHLASMEKEGVTNIATEDEGFDKIKEVKRIWITKSVSRQG
jgi:uncharacterized protein